MTVGWRKGDAASLVAKSAGGQAVSLLCLCLGNLYNSADTGTILFELSRRLLQRDISISSIAKLAGVADILAGKAQALGFGNFLAEQTMQRHKTFEQLGNLYPLISGLHNERIYG
jgi:hypothetical protein